MRRLQGIHSVDDRQIAKLAIAIEIARKRPDVDTQPDIVANKILHTLDKITSTPQDEAIVLKIAEEGEKKDSKPAPVIFETPSGNVVVHPQHESSSIEQMLEEALWQARNGSEPGQGGVVAA